VSPEDLLDYYGPAAPLLKKDATTMEALKLAKGEAYL
jgi:hypothetical protein